MTAQSLAVGEERQKYQPHLSHGLYSLETIPV